MKTEDLSINLNVIENEHGVKYLIEYYPCRDDIYIPDLKDYTETCRNYFFKHCSVNDMEQAILKIKTAVEDFINDNRTVRIYNNGSFRTRPKELKIDAESFFVISATGYKQYVRGLNKEEMDILKNILL